MEFDESKVRSEWSDELEGKKGWFGDNINGNSKDEEYLRKHVETNNKCFYGICYKGGGEYPFGIGNTEKTGSRWKGTFWKYFYPEEDIVEFDKKNLFIAGYNDDDVNIGDEGIIAEDIDFIKRNINNTEERSKIADIKYSGFYDTKRYGCNFFYRTKCAPKKHYIPWTKDNFPLRVLSLVRSKVDTDFTTFIGGLNLCKNEINIGSADTKSITFNELFDYWELPDGSPCGIEK